MRFLGGFGYFLTSEEIRKSRLLLHPLVHGSIKSKQRYEFRESVAEYPWHVCRDRRARFR